MLAEVCFVCDQNFFSKHEIGGKTNFTSRIWCVLEDDFFLCCEGFQFPLAIEHKIENIKFICIFLSD